MIQQRQLLCSIFLQPVAILLSLHMLLTHHKAVTLPPLEWVHLICWDSAVRAGIAGLLPRGTTEPLLAGKS